MAQKEKANAIEREAARKKFEKEAAV